MLCSALRVWFLLKIPNVLNSYFYLMLQVICTLGETLEEFDDDGLIPAYGFGDKVVKDMGIFPLKKDVYLKFSFFSKKTMYE